MADSSPLTEIIAISSVVIAVCALGISIWQGYIARQHNKLSVVPILHVDLDTTEGKDIEIVSVNNGVGPAIITHFTVYCDDVAYDFPDTTKYREIVQKLGLDPRTNWCDAEIPPDGGSDKSEWWMPQNIQLITHTSEPENGVRTSHSNISLTG
jgi:hypothetical protein